MYVYPAVPQVVEERGIGWSRRTTTAPGLLPLAVPWGGAALAVLVGYYAAHRGSGWRAVAAPGYRKWLRRAAAAARGVAVLGAAAYVPWQKTTLARQRLQADYRLSQLWLLYELHEQNVLPAGAGPPGGPIDVPPQVIPKQPARPPAPTLEDLLARDAEHGAYLRTDPVTGGPLTYHPRRLSDEPPANDRTFPVLAYYPPAADGLQPVLLPGGDTVFVHERQLAKPDNRYVELLPAAEKGGGMFGQKSAAFVGWVTLGAALALGPLVVMAVLGWYVPGRVPTSPLRAPAQVVAALIAGVYGLVGLFAALLLFGAALDGAATGGPAGPVLGGLLVAAFAVAMIVVAVRLGRAASVER